MLDYLPLAKLLWAPAGKSVGEVIACRGTLYERLVEPLLVAALNIEPPDGSAELAGAIIRETLAVGGRACRPLIAREGLGTTLIEPALAHLQARGAAVRIEHQLRALRLRRTRGSRRSISAPRPWRSAPTTPSSSRCRPTSPRRCCAI